MVVQETIVMIEIVLLTLMIQNVIMNNVFYITKTVKNYEHNSDLPPDVIDEDDLEDE